MTIQMKEISAAKFHNNRKGGKKMLEESVNSIGQFLKFIGHYVRLLNINELMSFLIGWRSYATRILLF